MAEEKLFNDDILTHNLSVRAIYYTTKFGEDLYFNENPDLEYSSEYDVLTHKENPRDHIIILEYNIIEPSEDETKNEFHIIVEGHFEITENVEEKFVEDAKHFGSLAILLSFLRTSVFNITSMTTSGAHHIPLINIKTLHDSFIGKPMNKKKKQSPTKPKKS